jgi:hypothetical protein
VPRYRSAQGQSKIIRCKKSRHSHLRESRLYGCYFWLHTCSIDRLAGKKRYLSSNGVGFSCRCWSSSGRSSIRCPSRGLPKPSQRSSDARKADNRISAQPDCAYGPYHAAVARAVSCSGHLRVGPQCSGHLSSSDRLSGSAVSCSGRLGRVMQRSSQHYHAAVVSEVSCSGRLGCIMQQSTLSRAGRRGTVEAPDRRCHELLL